MLFEGEMERTRCYNAGDGEGDIGCGDLEKLMVLVVWK